MDPPSSAVSREALQRRAYLLAEAAGFPHGQSEHFWLMAEQELSPNEPASARARKAPIVSKRNAPAPAVEAAPVHPTRRKPATKTTAKAVAKPPAESATKAPAASASAKKEPAKHSAKPRQPKAGEAP